KRAELSSDFIYQVITQFGGPEIFFRQFYITAVCPIGFISDSKNINYYDNKELTQSVQGFIIQNIELQLRFGIDRTVAFCLGEGENFKFLNRLNTKYRFFEKIIPLAHPRFIMQYRRKLLVDYVNAYLNALNGNNSLKMQ
ncbi:MAG: uracil-DNA glycosylase family protein, partial [Bacteroidota bacterium]